MIDRKKKLYISDLDGTLLTPESEIPERDIERLNRLIARGLQFTVATARNYDSALPLIKDLDLRLPVILFNGVYLTDFNTGKNVTQSQFVSRRVLDDILTLVAPLKMDPFVYTYGDIHRIYFLHPRNAGSRTYVQSLNGDPRLRKVESYDFHENENISGLLLVDTLAALDPVHRTLKERFGDTLNLYFAPDFTTPGFYWLQAFHRSASKGAMLRTFSDYLDFPLERMVVFGDNVNDLEMFEAAGRAIAVENAFPEALAAADEVIGSNGDGAVIDYLESFGII